MRISTWLQCISGLLILLFLYTTFSKWAAFSSFRQVLYSSPLIGKWASWFAYGLPLTETLLSLLLFIPSTRLVGFYASAGLLLLFTGYIGYMLLYVPHLPCSCGGVIGQLSWKQHLLFNLFFFFLSVTGILLERKRNHRVHPSIPFPSGEDVS